jgi:hypothetical protein
MSSTLSVEVRSASTPYLYCYIIDSKGRSVLRVLTPQDWQDGRSFVRAEGLDSGTYTVLLHPQRASEVARKQGPPLNLQALVGVTVLDVGQSVQAELRPGSIYRCRAVDPAGFPLGRTIVHFRPTTFPCKDFVYSAFTDADGWFELQGIPPGQVLEVMSSQNVVPRDPVVVIKR